MTRKSSLPKKEEFIACMETIAEIRRPLDVGEPVTSTLIAEFPIGFVMGLDVQVMPSAIA